MIGSKSDDIVCTPRGASASFSPSSSSESSKRAHHHSLLSSSSCTAFWCRMLIVGGAAAFILRYYSSNIIVVNSFQLAVTKLSSTAASARRNFGAGANLQRHTHHQYQYHHHHHRRSFFWTLQSVSNNKPSITTTTTTTRASTSSTNTAYTINSTSTMTAAVSATTQQSASTTNNGGGQNASSSSCMEQRQEENLQPATTTRARRVSFFQNNNNNNKDNNDNNDNNNNNSISILEACGERIRNGALVAFPTETVYGLGCNALNAEACQKVFLAKERPLTDPLIAHVNYPHEAYALWHATSVSSSSSSSASSSLCQNSKEQDDGDDTNHGLQHECLLLERRILETLCLEFWPGPLTLVARAAVASADSSDNNYDNNNNGTEAAAVVAPPSILMAGTGFVACRSPCHPIARSLIRAARVPIAAPSANKFGHVSPTTAQHVWDDLQYENVWIVEDDNDNTSRGEEESSSSLLIQHEPQEMGKQNSCDIGVESTVAKLEVKVTTTPSSSSPSSPSSSAHLTATLRVLRQGAIAAQELDACLQKALSKGLLSRRDIGKDDSSAFPSIQLRVLSQHKNTTVNDHVATVAPGQTIRHYSPRIPSFVLSHECIQRESSSSSSVQLNNSSILLLQQAVVVDFGQALVQWKNVALAYRDLSDVGDSAQAARCVFETLRWAEQVANAKRIFFPSLLSTTMKISAAAGTNHEMKKEDKQPDDALLLAVEDRLTRAASGVMLERLEDAKI